MLHINELSAGILRNITLHVQKGQCVAICGPSGCGKTTLLNAIAGNIASHGSIEISKQPIADLPPWKRPCRYLNQRLYLFPYLTLCSNLKLAQYAAKIRRNTDQCLKVLEQMGIAHLAHRYPQQVSGGEQQRAALARALISQPPLLLLDEPFASLDWQTRTDLWQVIQQLKLQKMTIMLVTHEPKEAQALADRIYQLRQGQLQN